MKLHKYEINIEWTGNQGKGTLNNKAYNRNHFISGFGKYDKVLASSDPSFLGDGSKYNPEDLFLTSISACHMLCYLHLCAVNNIIVTDYVDNATGIMEEIKDGSGQFREVTLNPIVTIEPVESIKRVNGPFLNTVKGIPKAAKSSSVARCSGARLIDDFCNISNLNT